MNDAQAPPDVRDLSAGQVIDAFRLEAPLNPGGMANLWRVTRDSDTLPMVMKIPLVRPDVVPSSSSTRPPVLLDHGPSALGPETAAGA